MPGSDFDNPKVVERWCGDQRAYVEVYLRQQGVTHGPIGASPVWHVAPYLSIWAVEGEKPGKIGWWVICGDAPADRVPAKFVQTPRDAVRTFAARWKRNAASIRPGSPHPEPNLGPRDRWPELAKLLTARAELLAQSADDDALWPE